MKKVLLSIILTTYLTASVSSEVNLAEAVVQHRVVANEITMNKEVNLANANGGVVFSKFYLEANEGVTITVKPNLDNSSDYTKIKLYKEGYPETPLKDTYTNGNLVTFDYKAGSGGYYYLSLDSSLGNYDVGVYSAFFNIGVSNSTNSYNHSAYTAKQVTSGNFTINKNMSNWYYFKSNTKDKVDLSLIPHINSDYLSITLFKRNNKDDYSIDMKSISLYTNESLNIASLINTDGIYLLNIKSSSDGYYELVTNDVSNNEITYNEITYNEIHIGVNDTNQFEKTSKSNSLNLRPKWNLVSIPGYRDYNASELFENNKNNPMAELSAISIVWSYNVGEQGKLGWNKYIPGNKNMDFKITPQMGLWIFNKFNFIYSFNIDINGSENFTYKETIDGLEVPPAIGLEVPPAIGN